MKREDLIDSLGNLGYPIMSPHKKITKKNEVINVLNALIDLDEPRLIEGFPVVLAYCAHRGYNLDIQKLFSLYSENSKKRRNLEKLLLLSFELLNLENLQIPLGLETIAKSLKKKYGDLLSDEILDMGKGITLSPDRLHNTLKRYTANLAKRKSNKEKAFNRQKRAFQLNLHLSALFSPKQKEIVLKKYNGEPLSKTEQEYYSRTIKKKIEALVNGQLREIAAKLAKR
jgi:hypothetical protein